MDEHQAAQHELAALARLLDRMHLEALILTAMVLLDDQHER